METIPSINMFKLPKNISKTKTKICYQEDDIYQKKDLTKVLKSYSLIIEFILLMERPLIT